MGKTGQRTSDAAGRRTAGSIAGIDGGGITASWPEQISLRIFSRSVPAISTTGIYTLQIFSLSFYTALIKIKMHTKRCVVTRMNWLTMYWL